MELVNNGQSMLATDINYADALLLTDKITAILSLFLLLGIAPGIWLVLWFLSKLSEMDRELRLSTVGRDWGKVRLDKFTISCSVHVGVAKWYLNSKARQLNAVQEVDEFGDKVYLFGEAKQKFIQENLAMLSQSENTPINQP